MSSFLQFLQKPATGSVLSVASALSFFFNCMLLPTVGRSGVSVPHADKNQLIFLSVLAITFTLAALATWSKMARRAEDKSPLPIGSLSLCGICAALLVLQLTGLLAA